jgi:opacity protein-like surface antigen
VEISGYYDDDYCGLWGCSYYKDGDGGYGYTAHAGYRFMPYLAAEVSYVDPGLIRYNQGQVIVEGFPGVYKGKASLDITAWEVSLLGILPFADWWEVYLRAGVGFWQGENDQRLVSTSDGSVLNGRNDADGTDFLFGLGLGFVPAPDWAFRLEFQALTIDGEVLYTKKDTSLDSVLFELEYRF